MNFLDRAGNSFVKFLCKKLWPVASAKGETIVVVANRCGTQGKYTYAGSSAVLGLGNGLVKVYNVLSRDQRSLLIVDTLENPTYT
jgi:protein N-terminal amidase